jgi:hypothetical protein
MGSTPFGGKNVKGTSRSWRDLQVYLRNGNTVRLFSVAVNCPNLVQAQVQLALSKTTFRAVLGLSSQALFLEVTTEETDQHCSTLWLPQWGQTTPPSS